MKQYKEVVSERYDGETKNLSIYQSPYSLINTRSLYAKQKIEFNFIKLFKYLVTKKIDITTLKILDIGCGSGAWTRFFSEIRETPKGIKGIDLSTHRIEKARHYNSNIAYEISDIVSYETNEKYDIVSAIVVMMHFETEEEINKVLHKINTLLKPGGYFVWYEALCKSHFQKTDNTADHMGYNVREMDQLCNSAGLVKVKSYRIFTRFLGIHSASILKRFPKLPFPLLSFFEFIWPVKNGNVLNVYQKVQK